jgi:hypothetical protein
MLHEIRTVAHNGTDYNTMTRSGDSANQAAANSVSSENQEITIQPCGGDSSNKYSGEMMIISRDGAPVLGNCNIFIHLPYGSKDNYLIYCLFSYNAHITFHNLQPARRLWLLLYLVSGNKVPMGILRTEDWQILSVPTLHPKDVDKYPGLKVQVDFNNGIIILDS